MSNIFHSFKLGEDDFSMELYLVGGECFDDAKVPDGWIKWTIPGYEYIVVENLERVFEETIEQMNKDEISLVDAVHNYIELITGKEYHVFQLKKFAQS